MLSGVWEPTEPSCCLISAMTSCAPLALTFLLCCLHMPTCRGPHSESSLWPGGALDAVLSQAGAWSLLLMPPHVTPPN